MLSADLNTGKEMLKTKLVLVQEMVRMDGSRIGILARRNNLSMNYLLNMKSYITLILKAWSINQVSIWFTYQQFLRNALSMEIFNKHTLVRRYLYIFYLNITISCYYHRCFIRNHFRQDFLDKYFSWLLISRYLRNSYLFFHFKKGNLGR